MNEDVEADFLVDASNAFHLIFQMSALLNIRYICPSIATILINCYKVPLDLTIDGDVIYSNEGTTQEDPLGMPIYVYMYALATTPLIKKLST